jgi:hypothetical protein
VRGVEFDYKTPRYHNYNAMLQTELMANHSLEVGYVGTRGRNLEVFTGVNNVTKLLPPGTTEQAHVQWPNLARNSLLIRTVGVSSYDSMQLKFQRRYSQGLQFLMSYTLSEAKSNAGDSLSSGNLGNLRAPDVVGWDLKNDIGLAPFHTKHALVFSGSYDFPGQGAILGGWQTHWVASFYSGQPQTVTCNPATGAGTSCYALIVGDPYDLDQTVDQWYNPAAFKNPPNVATIGQTDFSPLGGTRGHLIGPGLKQLDLGFGKQIPIGRSRRLEIRGEAFNVTNTPAFQQPGNASLNYNDTRNFATITQMRNTPRQFQLGAKIYW